MRKITIDMIAKKAKVSPATVSLILNNNPRIPQKTKEKIKKIMQELNYIPNVAARALAKGKTDNIAIMSIFFSAWYEMMLIRGVEESIKIDNYSLTFISTGGDKQKEKNIIKDIIVSKKADGVLSFSIKPDKETAEFIKKNKFPFVLVGEKVKDINCVYFDDFFGAFLATEHLIKSGRKKLAIITHKQNKEWKTRDVKERLKGFLYAINKYNVYKPEIIEVKNVYFDDGIKACLTIEKNKNIDGVFCAAGDNTAVGILKQAKKAGIKIPEDIALIGYDDAEIATAVTPELTTIRQPIEKAGFIACEVLKDIINGIKREDIKFTPELIIRESA